MRLDESALVSVQMTIKSEAVVLLGFALSSVDGRLMRLIPHGLHE